MRKSPLELRAVQALTDSAQVHKTAQLYMMVYCCFWWLEKHSLGILDLVNDERLEMQRKENDVIEPNESLPLKTKKHQQYL